jgi:hypothetical protein
MYEAALAETGTGSLYPIRSDVELIALAEANYLGKVAEKPATPEPRFWERQTDRLRMNDPPKLVEMVYVYLIARLRVPETREQCKDLASTARQLLGYPATEHDRDWFKALSWKYQPHLESLGRLGDELKLPADHCLAIYLVFAVHTEMFTEYRKSKSESTLGGLFNSVARFLESILGSRPEGFRDPNDLKALITAWAPAWNRLDRAFQINSTAGPSEMPVFRRPAHWVPI